MPYKTKVSLVPLLDKSNRPFCSMALQRCQPRIRSFSQQSGHSSPCKSPRGTVSISSNFLTASIMVLAACKATYKLLDNPFVLQELENHSATCANAAQTLRTLRQTFCSLLTRHNISHSVAHRKLQTLQQAFCSLPTESPDIISPALQELENHVAPYAAAR